MICFQKQLLFLETKWLKSGERQQEDTFMPGISRKKHLRTNQDSAKTLPEALPRFQADSGRANRRFLAGAPKILRRGEDSRAKRGFHFDTGGPALQAFPSPLRELAAALPPFSRRSLIALPPLSRHSSATLPPLSRHSLATLSPLSRRSLPGLGAEPHPFLGFLERLSIY
jgi:hypothetical protein